MKSKDIVKTERNERITRQSYSRQKSLLIAVVAAALSVLSGCQEQMDSMRTESFDYSAPANGITPRLIPAQFASKVTLSEEFGAGASSDSNRDTRVTTLIERIASQYKTRQLYNLESTRETWKETYDGVGVPLLRIAF